MKKTGLHNSFDPVHLQRWFLDNHECWACGQNHIDANHHIVGRGNGDSECESSILNCAPLNNFQCHLRIHGELRLDANVRLLLQKTIKYLLSKGYEFNSKDEAFIMKYRHFYL